MWRAVVQGVGLGGGGQQGAAGASSGTGCSTRCWQAVDAMYAWHILTYMCTHAFASATACMCSWQHWALLLHGQQHTRIITNIPAVHLRSHSHQPHQAATSARQH